MRDYLTIGSVPAEEPCVQNGSPDYSPAKARAESQRYIDQLRLQFGSEPEGARLSIKGFNHDFGVYYEVVCYFDSEIPDSIEYAFRLEREAWVQWK